MAYLSKYDSVSRLLARYKIYYHFTACMSSIWKLILSIDRKRPGVGSAGSGIEARAFLIRFDTHWFSTSASVDIHTKTFDEVNPVQEVVILHCSSAYNH